MAAVHGFVEPGFHEVRDVFVANFDQGREVGAAFSAYYRGRKVVDLWGGVADVADGRPWAEDTIVLVFSSTKGATALCANVLVERGLLDVDAPVADYWPEFAQAGKGRMPVSYLLSHQAGLAWIDGDMTLEEALSWDPVVSALATQEPHWTPGTQHGYHATTYGWLVGEVIRRVSGRRVGTFFQEEVAKPLGLDFWIGLPESEEPRVAPLVAIELPGEHDLFSALDTFLGPGNDLGRALMAPGGAFRDQDVWNTRAMRAAEVPSANGVTDARSLALMYAAMVGEIDGIRILGPDQLNKAIMPQTSGPNRTLLGLDIQFGLGFMVRSSLLDLGAHVALGTSVRAGLPVGPTLTPSLRSGT
jgi:CubicO group peptidase (beta-lactamase class C family)